MSEENRSTHKLYEKEKIGEVQIADEVVAIIAGLAATEVEGVDSMAGNITNELVGKLGMKDVYKRQSYRCSSYDSLLSPARRKQKEQECR